MTNRRPVIIVGAGPVGLTTALEFAKLNIPFVVVEEDATVSTLPKAGTLMPRTLEIFDNIGVVTPVLEAGLRFDEIHFVERSSDKVLVHVDMHLLRDITAFPFVLNLPQHELEPILLDAVLKSGMGTVLFNHKLVDFSQDASGCYVTVETEHGQKTLEGEYTIGCDGSHSALRKLLGVKMEGKTYPERFMVIDTQVPLDQREGRKLTYLSYVFDPNEWIIAVRQPKFWRFLFPVQEGDPDPSQEEMERKIRIAVGNLPVELVASSVYKVHHRCANRFRVGRAFLVGDAAHLITPVGGLGLNTGICDADNLPWKINMVMTGLASSDLLDTYEAERQPIAQFNAQNLADRNRRYIMMKNPVKRLIRNVALRYVEGSEKLKWQTAAQGSLLATSYNPVKRKPGGKILEGDRIPDGPLLDHSGEYVRLYNLIEKDFIALTFADARNRPVLDNDVDGFRAYLITSQDATHDTELRKRSFLDLGGRLRQRLGAQPGEVYLVRPDGYVAKVFAGNQKTALEVFYEVLGEPDGWLKPNVNWTKPADERDFG
ncbi:FAD-dependent monooxygenase [Alicyclobacillus sp. SO9]|uniref:FAD-dependent monooxygenase n=1 Tax=Alicyclobacillus sp. SO9 TaxID=2665646 RepID=UPI0018E875A0|nr:FAD-dependent monooxygenase [Alicyclobacillus sp. SO9]QQE80510.1 FAD-dependent monooxygenase [Alicyclobacillus sp. SO9]